MEINKTQANFIKNITKEYCENLQSELNNLNIVSAEISLIDGDFSKTIKDGGASSSVNIQENLNIIAKCYALSAFLGEEIKRLDNELKALDRYTIDDYVRENGITRLSLPVMVEAKEDYILLNLSNEDRATYYSAQAIAAHYGKALHDKGFMSNLKKTAADVTANPIKVTGTGRDTVIEHQWLPSYTSETINVIYFELQGVYRQAQKEANKLEAKIKDLLNKENRSRFEAYNTAYEAYKNEYNELNAKCSTYIINKREEISKKKITIPQQLEDIYNKLAGLAK